MDYLSNLRYIIMSEEGRKKTSLYYSLYTQDEKFNREIVPIFSINIGDRKNPNYKYLTYVDEKGLVPIAQSEITKRIENGIYNIIPGQREIRGIDYEEIKSTEAQSKRDENRNYLYDERDIL
ncbi:MAG: hypothetical protein J6K42_04635 [Clostridia bacterium]|nr:hypothetical protein [Clostridia bacterium]